MKDRLLKALAQDPKLQYEVWEAMQGARCLTTWKRLHHGPLHLQDNQNWSMAVVEKIAYRRWRMVPLRSATERDTEHSDIVEAITAAENYAVGQGHVLHPNLHQHILKPWLEIDPEVMVRESWDGVIEATVRGLDGGSSVVSLRSHPRSSITRCGNPFSEVDLQLSLKGFTLLP